MILNFADTLNPQSQSGAKNREAAIVAAHGKAMSGKGRKANIPAGPGMTPEVRKLGEWIAEYAAQEDLTFEVAMAHIIQFLKSDPEHLAYYPKSAAIFSERSAGSQELSAVEHRDKLGALGEKVSKVQPLSPSEIEKLKERRQAVSQALNSYHRSWDSFKIPDGVVLTPEEVKLAQWITEYADQQKLTFKEAMAHVFDYLKNNPSQLAKYTKGDASFAETSASSVSPPADWTEFDCSQSALGHLRRIHLYQAGTGCSFSEAVGEIL